MTEPNIFEISGTVHVAFVRFALFYVLQQKHTIEQILRILFLQPKARELEEQQEKRETERERERESVCV